MSKAEKLIQLVIEKGYGFIKTYPEHNFRRDRYLKHSDPEGLYQDETTGEWVVWLVDTQDIAFYYKKVKALRLESLKDV